MRLKRSKYFTKALATAASALIFSTLLSASAYADYKSLIKDTFWGKIYKDGGKTFFCNKSFSKKTALLAASHIYPSQQVRDHLQCGTKRQCLRSDDRYNRIISDLHNIVPADSYFEFKRKGAKFGRLDESIEANNCGIRKKLHILDPPDEIKGDIARILFYMKDQYELPLNTHLPLLKQWHEGDPPSDEEISRNIMISEYQGNENQFVSNPSLVYNLD